MCVPKNCPFSCSPAFPSSTLTCLFLHILYLVILCYVLDDMVYWSHSLLFMHVLDIYSGKSFPIYVFLMDRSTFSNFSIILYRFLSFCSSYIAMSVSDTVGPADAPWDTPDPLTCVRQLQSLVGLGFNVGHESAGDLQTLIQSAMSGIRKEVDLHMDFMGTEHVEHKTDHQLQRKMVRFWKCSAVTLHENQTFYVGDTEPESDHVYYQWNKMKNLPGWWVKKIWHSYDGWLLVTKKEEFSLLVFDPPRQLDQRVLVEETISSEGSMESQRQTLVARTMVVNLEQIYILTKPSAAQLEKLKVDFVKKAIQVLCWECFHIGLLKRNFKMWLQTSPYNTPGFPYGRFSAVDYDMTWQEVLDIHQIPHDQRHIHLRAHQSF